MALCAYRVDQLTEISRELVEDALGATPVDPRYGRAVLRLQQRLLHQFEYAEDPDRVVIDLRDPHVWDASAVAALDASTPNDQRKGKPV